MEFAGADDIDGKPEGVSEWESANGASGKPCDIDVPKHRRSPRTGEVESINFLSDDVGIQRWQGASFTAGGTETLSVSREAGHLECDPSGLALSSRLYLINLSRFVD